MWGPLTRVLSDDPVPCLQSILSNSKCWVQHMQLNQSTGLDPDGVMLRASEGLAAVDFLMPRCTLGSTQVLYTRKKSGCQPCNFKRPLYLGTMFGDIPVKSMVASCYAMQIFSFRAHVSGPVMSASGGEHQHH